MIKLTRLNHVPLILNSDLIEHIDVTPDTVITMTSGQKFVVLESAGDVVESVIAFRKSIVGPEPHGLLRGASAGAAQERWPDGK
jgi:flagellar protein FlbD